MTGAVGSDQYVRTSYVSAPLTVLPATIAADGNWSGAVPFNGIFNFTLAHSGAMLSGTWATTFPDSANDEHGTLSGSVHGAHVSFSINGRSISNCADIDATLESQNSMSGLFSTSNCRRWSRDGTIHRNTALEATW